MISCVLFSTMYDYMHAFSCIKTCCSNACWRKRVYCLHRLTNMLVFDMIVHRLNEKFNKYYSDYNGTLCSPLYAIGIMGIPGYVS